MRRFPLLASLLVVCSACVLGPLTGVAAAASTDTIFGSAAPTRVDSGDGSAVELGVKFNSSTAGELTGIRFYKASTNTGTHIGNLWSSSGQLLATATFTNETASGWQQVSFANPVAITAGTTYIASYYAPHGHYSSTTGGLSSAVTNAPLQAIGNGTSADGVYAYGSKSGFPTRSYQANNYWLDVMFTPGTTPPPPAPTMMASPSITGMPMQGHMLTASNGSWSGSPTSYAYRWSDCNASGANCTSIGGATSGSYVSTASDVGDTIKATVTATNAGGSTSATSNATATIAPVAPVVSGLPVVGGQAVVGQSLVASDGSWSGSPTVFAFQWQACDSSGGGCTNIAGATSGSYTLTGGEVGQTVDVVVTASNAGGSASATSAASAVVSSSAAPGASFTFSPAAPVTGSGVQFDGTGSTCAAGPCVYTWADDPPTGGSWPLGTGPTIGFAFMNVGTKYVTLTVTDALGRSASVEHNVVVTAASTSSPPANTAVPTVSGVAQQGQTLTASNGSWTGSPTSYAYQWQDCDSAGSSCTAIAGATSARYALGSSDVGHTIRVAETATNAAGSATAASAQTVVVAALSGPSAPSNTAVPVITGTAQSGQTLAVSNGSWSNGPTGYAYAWRDCDASGNSCTTISAATSSSYPLASSDVGHTVRAIVTATNAGGSTPATSAPTSVVSGSAGGCSGAANTPGGPDPWGGCFPGPNNTGVPAGTTLTNVSTNGETPPISGAPSDNTGWTYDSADRAIDINSPGAVIDGIQSTGVVDDGNGTGYTLKNSLMNGPIQSGGTNNGNVLIENSTINGGNQSSDPTVGIPNVDIESSNLSGGKDELNCEGSHCTLNNSYLHDQFTGNPASHQQGVDSDGTSNDSFTHNSVQCVGPSGQCTADFTFSDDGAITNVTVAKNLMIASPQAGFCIYPGPNATTITNRMANIAITGNVFQKGSTGECGYAGAVYGWYPSRCNTTTGGAPPSTPADTSCTFTGNTWDDGTTLNQPFR